MILTPLSSTTNFENVSIVPDTEPHPGQLYALPELAKRPGRCEPLDLIEALSTDGLESTTSSHTITPRKYFRRKKHTKLPTMADHSSYPIRRLSDEYDTKHKRWDRRNMKKLAQRWVGVLEQSFDVIVERIKNTKNIMKTRR